MCTESGAWRGRWSWKLTEVWCQFGSDTGEVWSRLTLNIKKGCARKPQWGTAEPGWDVTRANQQNSHDRTSPDDSCRHGHSSSVYPKSPAGYLKCICHIVWFMSDRLTSQFEKCQLGFILVHVVRFRREIFLIYFLYHFLRRGCLWIRWSQNVIRLYFGLCAISSLTHLN